MVYQVTNMKLTNSNNKMKTTLDQRTWAQMAADDDDEEEYEKIKNIQEIRKNLHNIGIYELEDGEILE